MPRERAFPGKTSGKNFGLHLRLMFGTETAHNNQTNTNRKLWEKGRKISRVTTLLESTVWCSTKKTTRHTEKQESMIHSTGKKLIKPVPEKDVNMYIQTRQRL